MIRFMLGVIAGVALVILYPDILKIGITSWTVVITVLFWVKNGT